MYAFLSFSLTSRVMQKLERERERGCRTGVDCAPVDLALQIMVSKILRGLIIEFQWDDYSCLRNQI